MNRYSEHIVVVFGWVGQANALSLLRMGYPVSFYDVATPKPHYADKYAVLYDQIRPLESPLSIDGPKPGISCASAIG